jgi:hypothetical protein
MSEVAKVTVQMSPISIFVKVVFFIGMAGVSILDFSCFRIESFRFVVSGVVAKVAL